jgi:hypothetical protein
MSKSKLISHRGNITGPGGQWENHPDYIDTALRQFDCEVDLWVIGRDFMLGHDKPQFKVDYMWLYERQGKLWIHCKNPNALAFCQGTHFNYFTHDKDPYTITSKNEIWAHPTCPVLLESSIWAVPEQVDKKETILLNLEKRQIWGICTDYPGWYATMLKDYNH